MVDARGVARTSKVIERNFPITAQRDGVCSGRKRRGEASALTRGVDDLRGEEAGRKILADDHVVVEQFVAVEFEREVFGVNQVGANGTMTYSGG